LHFPRFSLTEGCASAIILANHNIPEAIHDGSYFFEGFFLVYGPERLPLRLFGQQKNPGGEEFFPPVTAAQCNVKRALFGLSFLLPQ
jgi:hypothetical protein